VEEFPDFASWRHFADLREKLEWYSYSESWSMLGTWHEAVNPAEAVAPEPGKICQLFIIRGNTEAFEQLPHRQLLRGRDGPEGRRRGCDGARAVHGDKARLPAGLCDRGACWPNHSTAGV
jgi:hypothetical protein